MLHHKAEGCGEARRAQFTRIRIFEVFDVAVSKAKFMPHRLYKPCEENDSGSDFDGVVLVLRKMSDGRRSCTQSPSRLKESCVMEQPFRNYSPSRRAGLPIIGTITD